MGLLPARLASLGEIPFGFRKGAAARKAALVLAAVGGTRGVATGTFEHELALVPRTGFAFSTCAEMLLNIGESKGSRRKGLTTQPPTVVP